MGQVWRLQTSSNQNPGARSAGAWALDERLAHVVRLRNSREGFTWAQPTRASSPGGRAAHHRTTAMRYPTGTTPTTALALLV